MNYVSILKDSFEKPFDINSYRNFIVNFLKGSELKQINGLRSAEIFAEFSYYVQGFALVAEYTSPKREKVGIYAVKLKAGRDIEKARSKQRNFIARLIKDNNFSAAIVAFYLDEETKWRLSFVRMDYEFIKGKVTTSLTPAKRYSYLVGKNEPCHTAQESLLPIFEEENFNPTVDSIEKAFSVEKVTKQFFEKYKEKYLQLKEYLSTNEAFCSEAKRCMRSEDENLIEKFSEQFSKKFMGQLVFLYFLQKKGWLGVKALKSEISEKEYKDIYYYNSITREFAPRVYNKVAENFYRLNANEVKALTPKQEEMLAMCVKGNAWGTGSRTFVRDLFEIAKKAHENFFDDYLEPLFYEGLNQERKADNYYARLHCRIPFLNGGLFEPLDNYDWENNAFSIPNSLFSNYDENGRDADGILDVFDRYNFTMNEDEPLEKEVAVDPEMLGKIFENLLDVKDRKSKGAFYTPREIVHYMCQESLINYIINKIGTPYEDTKDFVLYGEIMKDEDCSRESTYGLSPTLLMADSIFNNLKEIDAALSDVRVADPAVGSGAFPMGMLSEIVKLREIITEYFAREICLKPEYKDAYKDERLKARMRAEIWKLRNETRNTYKLKKETMRNSIYAVDIEPSAVDITKLRLWLTLVVEQEIDPNDPENRSPLTLPNLDCNIMCGNSLIDEFEGIDLSFDGIISNEPTHISIWDKNVEIDYEKLFIAQRDYFYANKHDQKIELRERIFSLKQAIIDKTIEGISTDKKAEFEQACKEHSTPFFLWKLNFAKVFKEKGGFDIVIGNPPYVGESGNKEIFRPIAKTNFGKRFYMGKMDLLYFFFHKGIDLTNSKGEIALITTNYFITATGAKKLRSDFKSRTQIRKFINFDEYKIFESALGQHNAITFLTKNIAHPIDMKSCFCKETGVFESDRLLKILDGTDKNSIYSIVAQDKIYDGDNNYIRFNAQNVESSVIQKMQLCKTKLKDLFLVNQGVVTGCDTFTKRHFEKITIKDDILINDGIYVLDFENQRDVNVFNNFNKGKELCRDFYKNSDIERYTSSNKATKKLIYFEGELDKEKYPDVYAHLLKFKQLLEARLETYNESYHWTAIHRSRVAQIFEDAKIVLPYRAKSNAFAYNEIEWFCRSDAYVITSKQKDFSLKALLGFLNSTLYLYWLKKQGKVKGEILELMREPVEQIPLPSVDAETLQRIESLVGTIIDKKENSQNTEDLEKEVDLIVYSVFNLTPDEIALVEESIK